MAGLRRVEQVMGTAISVHIADPRPRRDLELLMDEALAWFHDVDRRFSTYLNDSEITLLDRGERTLADCSPTVRDVLDACGMLTGATDGYFDVHATGRLRLRQGLGRAAGIGPAARGRGGQPLPECGR
jgi:thiamine biosynthesis lipoprotein